MIALKNTIEEYRHLYFELSNISTILSLQSGSGHFEYYSQYEETFISKEDTNFIFESFLQDKKYNKSFFNNKSYLQTIIFVYRLYNFTYKKRIWSEATISYSDVGYIKLFINFDKTRTIDHSFYWNLDDKNEISSILNYAENF